MNANLCLKRRRTGIINHGEQVIRIDLLIEKSSTKDCCQLFQENGIISIKKVLGLHFNYLIAINHI